MKTYSDHGCHEGIMLFSVYHEPVQTIIIQDTIVDTFRCSTLLIYILISISTPRDVCVQPDVPLRPGFDNTSIFRRSAAAFAFCFVVFTIRTAPHLASNVSFGAVIISVWGHRNSCRADRSAVFINTDVIMDGLGMAVFAIKVNQGTYIPKLEKPVSGKIVHSRIKAHILYGKTGHIFFQLMESSKERDGIMASGAGKAEQERDIGMQHRIVAGELEQSIAKVKGIKVTVPPP